MFFFRNTFTLQHTYRHALQFSRYVSPPLTRRPCHELLEWFLDAIGPVNARALRTMKVEFEVGYWYLASRSLAKLRLLVAARIPWVKVMVEIKFIEKPASSPKVMFDLRDLNTIAGVC